MRMRIIQTAVCGIVAALMLTVATVPASAAEQLTPEPQAVPTEEVPVAEGAGPVVPASEMSPAGDLCDAGYSYRVYSNPTNDMRVFDRWGGHEQHERDDLSHVPGRHRRNRVRVGQYLAVGRG